jgi:hypothetical protein
LSHFPGAPLYPAALPIFVEWRRTLWLAVFFREVVQCPHRQRISRACKEEEAMTYRVFSQRCRTSDGIRYTGWGIEGSGEGEAPLRLEDVTEDKQFALLLAAALNREQAEPVHVFDIISDFLADPELKRSLLGR